MEIPDSNAAHKPSYQDQFHRSVDLFEKSFNGMQHASFEAQKEQYVQAMKESLHVMQEAANGMINEKLVQMKQKLDQDLKSYLKEPTESHKKAVQSDINSLKHTA